MPPQSALDGRSDAPDDEQISPDPDLLNRTRGFAYDDLRAACAPDSPARYPASGTLDQNVDSLVRALELLFRFPPEMGGFIHNQSRAYDICHNPALRHQHGNFIKPELHAKITRNKVYPVFSWSKYPASSDITIPTNFRFQWGKADTANWDDMIDKVMWRGTLTGMFADTQAVMKSQRHRLMEIVQDHWSYWSVLLQDQRTGRLEISGIRSAEAAKRWTDVGITKRSWWRKTEMESIVEATIMPSDSMSNAERAKYKLLLDIDGWGWSARYRELLRTSR